MSAWDSIFKLENTSIAIKEDVERNEAIGLLSMYLAMKCPPNYDFKKFENFILIRINEVINDKSINEIEQKDRHIILHLAFLTYRSFDSNGLLIKGSWPKNLKKNIGLCNFPGCDSRGVHKDHIWPKSLGGPFEIWNLQYLCEFHNKMKSNSPIFNFSLNNNFNLELINWFRRNGWI
jgi:hypothetical protein